jgi:hypothetical protein
MKNVQEAHARNFEIAKSDGFEDWMNHEIRRVMAFLFRIHASGDFFDLEYTLAWLNIVRANRRTKFYAYTRSWTDEEMLPVLVELGREPNFEMWFSWDKAMPFPPRRKGFGLATCRRTTAIFLREKPT